MKRYTLKELKKATLDELGGTYFKCTPKRYERIQKSLDCVEGLRWFAGEKPSGYGTEVYPYGPSSSLYYAIINGRIRRSAVDSLRNGLTRISIKA